MKAFLYSANPLNHPFSDSQLHRAEVKLNLSRVAASTTADEALLSINLTKRHLYWNYVYPAGIADVNPRNIIDIDEMGIEIEHQNRSFGKTFVGDRCSQQGKYNRNKKLNVMI